MQSLGESDRLIKICPDMLILWVLSNVLCMCAVHDVEPHKAFKEILLSKKLIKKF